MIIHQQRGVTVHMHNRRQQAMRVLDEAAKRATAAGFVIIAENPNQTLHAMPKALLVKRSNYCDVYPGTWAFPGGGIDGNETAYAAALREVWEEIGIRLIASNGHEDCGVHKGFHTFLHYAPSEFDCRLNHEHDAYTWAALDRLPTPMHPNAAEILGTIRDAYQIFEEG